jgi:hypothetical protein
MKDKVYVTAGELKALDESIVKWEQKVVTRDGEEIIASGAECPCCINAGYDSGGADCSGRCAIGKDGHGGCINTPFHSITDYTMTPALRTLCMDELNYLRDLRDRCVVGEESRFEVGDYVYYSGNMGGVVRINRKETSTSDMNAEWVYRNGAGYQIGECHVSVNSIYPELFYAPPTPEQLDEWGMDIDRIGVPEMGDRWAGLQASDKAKPCDSYAIWGNSGMVYKDGRPDAGTPLDTYYNGLRYILKPRKKAIKDMTWEQFRDEYADKLEELI